jgi:CubicO group peptidase (beta-lactamase class C family)
MQHTDPRELGFSPERLAQVSAVARAFIDAGEIAGVTVGLHRHGRLAFVESYGSRDLEQGLPMTRDTLVRIYSMTKPITSAAVLLLFERAQVQLTDPLSRYFPAFAEMEVYLGGEEPPFRTVPAEREILVRDLLTHTGGLAYGIGDEHPVEQEFAKTVWGGLAADPQITLEQQADMIAEQPLVHQPGTAWRYSIATDLLGALVERVTGTSIDRFLKRELFEPLGMENTWFTVPEPDHHRLAKVYTQGTDGLCPAEDPPVMSFLRTRSHPSGGGGLVSTVDDYLRFAQMLLDHGHAADRHILAPRTVSMMMQDHLPPGIEGWDRPGLGFGFGGQVITDARRCSSYGAPGTFSWGGAASTTFWVDPAEELAGVILLQLVPAFSSRINDDLYASVYQAIVS